MTPIFQRKDGGCGEGAFCEACRRVWEKHKPPLYLCPDNDEDANINMALDGLTVQAYRSPAVMAELRIEMDRALAGLRRDAARWRALVGCARVRVVGHAGLTPGSPHAPFEEPYAHIGIELWTLHHTPREDSEASRITLTFFADKARQAKP